MKPQNIVIALALITGAAGLSAVAEWRAAPVEQVAPAEIDFTALHRQASDALDNLRRSQQSRATTGTAAF
jgi:hypothetical protein